jgi:flavin reductase (DIM6/NTAB) family NADH-FMN oxidoreductase RutF
MDRAMSQDNGSTLAAAIGKIPCGVFVLTAAYESARSGVLTRWIQPCSVQPPLLMVAIKLGSAVEPLIRDSHCFAICQVSDNDRTLLRRFAITPTRGDDPFLTIPARRATTGSPIIERALAYLDCEIVRVVDLDADHRLYVGEVLEGDVINPERHPAVELVSQSAHKFRPTPNNLRIDGTRL